MFDFHTNPKLLYREHLKLVVLSLNLIIDEISLDF